jgi:outer membrane protein OmpA-like peptidoglycan-associated protein
MPSTSTSTAPAPSSAPPNARAADSLQDPLLASSSSDSISAVATVSVLAEAAEGVSVGFHCNKPGGTKLEGLVDGDQARLKGWLDRVADTPAAVLLAKKSFTPTVEVTGHASAEGSDSHNKDLGQRRATAVGAYIKAGYRVGDVAQSVSVEAGSVGEAQADQTATTEAQRAPDRKAVVNAKNEQFSISGSVDLTGTGAVSIVVDGAYLTGSICLANSASDYAGHSVAVLQALLQLVAALKVEAAALKDAARRKQAMDVLNGSEKAISSALSAK